MNINTKYSFQSLGGKSFKDIPAEEFNNTIIKGSCFYQESTPDADIFPVGMTDVEFQHCNLDNVLIPAGNTIGAGCCARQILVQNDNEDWILRKVDDKYIPEEPMRKHEFVELGISISPDDIPRDKLATSRIQLYKDSLKGG